MRVDPARARQVAHFPLCWRPHVEQHWHEPDAEVKVAFPPGVIAPVSGLDQAMIFRMLEDAVARKLDPSY